ncbi:hypothetical protein M378DRAFT_161965 [Amanita muscaria Koide BX008]|uniref:Uncharacterized protein n=1 Tax=Amanita muscaria (strain Koide BX008) TaxID=946122 RepID=A0A0C2WV75_AMAMK|nr:hypothetical protein M378DRAFT_161965 [Amanita muscaria Koide BX008]
MLEYTDQTPPQNCYHVVVMLSECRLECYATNHLNTYFHHLLGELDVHLLLTNTRSRGYFAVVIYFYRSPRRLCGALIHERTSLVLEETDKEGYRTSELLPQ